MSDTPRDTKDTAPERDPRAVHKGFGKYEFEGVRYDSYDEAAAAIAAHDAAMALEAVIGDLEPDEDIKVTDRTLVYRNSIMELPMNEPYLPDGSYSPHYDRTYLWAWSRLDGVSITAKRAQGYRLVSEEELKASIEAGITPEHYASLFHADGSMLTYGDSVLMRIPRVKWRQLQAEKEAAAMRAIKRTDEEQYAAADKLGMKVEPAPIKNEITTGLKVSGF